MEGHAITCKTISKREKGKIIAAMIKAIPSLMSCEAEWIIRHEDPFTADIRRAFERGIERAHRENGPS